MQECEVANLGFGLTLLLGAFGGILFSGMMILLLSPHPYGPPPGWSQPQNQNPDDEIPF